MGGPRKKSLVPATVETNPQAPVVVAGPEGLVHRSTLAQLRKGFRIPDDALLVIERESMLWNGGSWTSDDVRKVLVRMVSEGMSLRAALEELRESHPPMPSYFTVHGWLGSFPDFKKNYQIARKMRAEAQAEAATELVIQALDDPKLDPRSVKNAVEQLRWSASKMDRETFGEHRTLELQKPLAELSDNDLDVRIKALMADPEVRGVLNDQGFEIMDVEIVESEEAGEPGPHPGLAPGSEGCPDPGAGQPGGEPG